MYKKIKGNNPDFANGKLGFIVDAICDGTITNPVSKVWGLGILIMEGEPGINYFVKYQARRKNKKGVEFNILMCVEFDNAPDFVLDESAHASYKNPK